MSTDLWKFADLHNRRDYQLIRFAMSAESDYRTMQKAIKELSKRIKEGPSNIHHLLESLHLLLYRCALIIYNRSHVPAIMDISRTDQHGLAGTAHELLRDISTRNPEVLKTHIKALCKELEDTSPSSKASEEVGAADTLKACSQFARKYPSEVPKDRKFITALTNFSLFSKSPRASKHAVTILLTVVDRKEMHARDILTKSLKDCDSDSPYHLSRLATISQICLMAPTSARAEIDAIDELTTHILQNNSSPNTEEDANTWDDTIDIESQAKELALRTMVNRCRSGTENNEEFAKVASPVLQLLTQLITNDGEITQTKDTPPAQRNRLRLLASNLLLKLCSHDRRCEELVTPSTFISVALTVINPPNQVRSGFTHQLKKYLGQNKLSHRWFTVLFLLAFEPDVDLRSSTLTWLRSRVQYFERLQQQQVKSDKKSYPNVMESMFARLLSIMAHHPDYPLEDDSTFDVELLDFSKYIVFYLSSVATEDNLSLIFHIAQRVKQTRDNVTGDDEISQRLYVLSDLAQATIRNYADMMPAHAKGVNLLQTWPGSVSLPKSLFKSLPNHEVALKIADKNHLPEDTALGLEKLIRDYIRLIKGSRHPIRRTTYDAKKRKTISSDPDDLDEGEEEQLRSVKKKQRTTSLPVRKTPKAKKFAVSSSSPILSSAQPTRKSARASAAVTSVSYAERDSDDDDQEMEDIDRLASSPVRPKKAAQKINGHRDGKDVETSNGLGVRVHEDSDVGLEDVGDESHTVLKSALKGGKKGKAKSRTEVAGTEDEDEAEEMEVEPEADEVGEDDEEGEDDGELTPSPLKERSNPSTIKTATKRTTPKSASKTSTVSVAKGKGKAVAKGKDPVVVGKETQPEPKRETRRTRSAK
jgi:sister-chromatid-cohesion protein PDS5